MDGAPYGILEAEKSGVLNSKLIACSENSACPEHAQALFFSAAEVLSHAGADIIEIDGCDLDIDAHRHALESVFRGHLVSLFLMVCLFLGHGPNSYGQTPENGVDKTAINGRCVVELQTYFAQPSPDGVNLQGLDGKFRVRPLTDDPVPDLETVALRVYASNLISRLRGELRMIACAQGALEASLTIVAFDFFDDYESGELPTYASVDRSGNMEEISILAVWDPRRILSDQYALRNKHKEYSLLTQSEVNEFSLTAGTYRRLILNDYSESIREELIQRPEQIVWFFDLLSHPSGRPFSPRARNGLKYLLEQSAAPYAKLTALAAVQQLQFEHDDKTIDIMSLQDARLEEDYRFVPRWKTASIVKFKELWGE